MKTYIVYLMGKEVGYIKARNHNHAEELAWKRFKGGPMTISVAYTELWKKMLTFFKNPAIEAQA